MAYVFFHAGEEVFQRGHVVVSVHDLVYEEVENGSSKDSVGQNSGDDVAGDVVVDFLSNFNTFWTKKSKKFTFLNFFDVEIFCLDLKPPISINLIWLS